MYATLFHFSMCADQPVLRMEWLKINTKIIVTTNSPID